MVLLALAAGTARAASVHLAPHAHHVARFKLGDGAARRHDAAIILWSGTQGWIVLYQSCLTLCAHTAVQHVDVHLVGLEWGALNGHRLEAVENEAGGPVRFGRNDFHEVRRGKKRAVKKGVTTSGNEKNS